MFVVQPRTIRAAGRWLAGMGMLLAALMGRAAAATDGPPPSAPLYLALATHSEDTPNYSASKLLYVNNRNALIAFAQAMAARNLRWNWECDWNFLNAAYTNEVLVPDPNLLAATANTNIVAWLRHVMEIGRAHV